MNYLATDLLKAQAEEQKAGAAAGGGGGAVAAIGNGNGKTGMLGGMVSSSANNSSAAQLTGIAAMEHSAEQEALQRFGVDGAEAAGGGGKRKYVGGEDGEDAGPMRKEIRDADEIDI